MKLTAEKKTLVVLVFAFAILAAVSLFTLGSAVDQANASAWVASTHEVLQKLDQLVNSLSDAENGRRGYLLSGQERYLLHHEDSKERVRRTLEDLRGLSRNNSRLKVAWEQLEPMVRRRLEILDESIKIYQERGLDIARQLRFMEQGRLAMQPIRDLVAQIWAAEDVLLKERQDTQRSSVRGTIQFIIVASTLSLSSFGGLFVLFARENRRRRQAEEELQRTNQDLEKRVQRRTAELSQTVEKVAWLASFPENNPNPVVELDLQKDAIHYANPYSIQTFPDLHSQGLQHPFLAGVKEAAKPLLEGETGPVRREVIVKQSCYSQTISYVPEFQRLRVYSSDITERKHTEQVLAAERTLLRTLLDALPDLVFTKDAAGHFSMCNAAELRHLGLAAEREILGKSVFDLYPRELAEMYHADDLHVLGGNPVLGREEPSRDTGGAMTWHVTTKVPLRDPAGRILGMVGTSHDITQRKRTEQRLQTELERLNLLDQITRAIGQHQDLQSIFQVVLGRLEDQMPIDFGCVCVYDPSSQDLTVTSIGSKSQPLAVDLELPQQTSIRVDQNGLSRCVAHNELVHEPDISQVNLPFPQRLARGGLRSMILSPLIVDSSVFGVLVLARREPASFSSGDCEFLRQLSDHVALAANQARLYTALQRSYDDLRQTQQAVMRQERLRALGQMASGIAHDINNALSPVSLYTESLLETEPGLSARARDYLEVTKRAVEDVAQTVARMREFYRQREPQLTLMPVQLNNLVQQVLHLTRARWNDIPQQHGIVIHTKTDLAPDLPVVLGVEGEIREALTNLVMNAVDAMPTGGILTVRTTLTADSARLEVTDTGVGMDEDTRKRCLEPFFTTKGERGTGLGLAMVFGVAERHSAEIEIQSNLGRGTTIGLSFPLPKIISPRLAQSAVTPRACRLRILAVDDDPIVISSLRDILEGDGHSVSTANNGSDGIEMFRVAHRAGESFALVITDLGMPYVDGRQVASAVKAESPSTPVILLTGWGQQIMAHGNVPSQVDCVLSKPPRLQELRDALAKCCPPARSGDVGKATRPDTTHS